MSGNANVVIENFQNHNTAIINDENVVPIFDQIITAIALGRAIIQVHTKTRRSNEIKLLLCVSPVAQIHNKNEFRLFLVYFSILS